MADITLAFDQQTYPNGTELGVYPVSNWVVPGEPSGAPKGDPLATELVADGAVTFEGLSPGRYWVVGVDGPYRYYSVMVPAPSGDVDPGDITPGEDTEVLTTVDGVATWAAGGGGGGGGGGGIEWHVIGDPGELALETSQGYTTGWLRYGKDADGWVTIQGRIHIDSYMDSYWLMDETGNEGFFPNGFRPESPLMIAAAFPEGGGAGVSYLGIETDGSTVVSVSPDDEARVFTFSHSYPTA